MQNIEIKTNSSYKGEVYKVSPVKVFINIKFIEGVELHKIIPGLFEPEDYNSANLMKSFSLGEKVSGKVLFVNNNNKNNNDNIEYLDVNIA